MAATIAAAAAVSSCSSGPGALDTEPVAQLIDDVLDNVLDDDFAELDECLIDDADDLLDDTFDDVDEDVVDEALRGEFEALAFDLGSVEYLDCSLFAEENGVGFYFAEAPRDFEDFSFDLASGGDSEADADVDIDEGEEFRGGQFFEVCAEFEGEVSYCELDWLDDNILIGVYILSTDADRVDLDDVEVRFREILPEIVADLGDDDDRDVDVATTAGS